MAEKSRLFGGGKPIHVPTIERQEQRLRPQFRQLQRAFDSERMVMETHLADADPEKVLVMEVVGTVDDFFRAVGRIEGMEWLFEVDQDELEPDADFYHEGEDAQDRGLHGQLFLIMSNQAALNQMLSLWNRHRRGEKLAHGLGRWKSVFKHLRDVRPWDVPDRLRDTGLLEDWRSRLELGQALVRFESELWYREAPEKRVEAETRVTSAVEDVGGRVIKRSLIEPARYHGLLGEIPADTAASIIRQADISLFRENPIMFLRPVGQAAVALPLGDVSHLAGDEELPGLPSDAPILAVLDGLPIENHHLLRGRIVVDDPDGWAEAYPPVLRSHGTNVTSLSVHGELGGSGATAVRPVYVRPVLKADIATTRESVPDDELMTDLIHRAVQRMFEDAPNATAVARSVRIINLSIGDPSRPFGRTMSAAARIIDWLSWKYRVLFIVSAGNCADSLDLDLDENSLGGASRAAVQEQVIKSVATQRAFRRLLSPAESINSLTIGASHADSSGYTIDPPLLDPMETSHLPAPYSRVGPGYNRSVKPDLLAAGGRQSYQVTPATKGSIIHLNPYRQPPGLQTAAVGSSPGDLEAMIHVQGTSFATAMISNVGAQIGEELHQLRTRGNQDLPSDLDAALIKALLVHASGWGEATPILASALGLANRTELSSRAIPLLGFGAFDATRALTADDHRAVMLAANELDDGEAHVFRIPLPQSLSGHRAWRRLTITLAWFSPINPEHHKYRRGMLWFEPPAEELNIARRDCDWRAARRGTVQHEILEGDAVSIFERNQQLELKISCRADAGNLGDPLPYGLAVTLEVAPELGIPIYDEISARIRSVVEVRASG